MSMWLDMAGTGYRIGFVQAGGIRTRYLEAGAEHPETVLFLHGSGGYLEAYLRNIPQHAERYRVLAIDMIGHGFTDKPDHPYEPKDYVGHIAAVLDALQIERVHISGESLGGWVAARFASTYPHRVGKLILNTAAGVHFDPEVSARIHKLSLAAAIEPNRDTVRKRLEWLMLDPGMVSDEMVELRHRVYSQPGFAKAMENIMCLHTERYRVPNLLTAAELASIRSPALVVWTTHDPGSTVEVGRKLAAGIPGAEFVIMENCGHWPQFEDAPRFNALQMKFLAS